MQKQLEWGTVKLAHPGGRYLGQFLDFLIALLLFFSLLFLFEALGLDNGFTGMLTLSIPFGYFLFSDALPHGQSLGKKPLGYYVVSKATGEPCGPLQSLVRNILTPILGFIDAIFILWGDRQRLGDKLAKTIVIHGQHADSLKNV